MPLTIEEQKKMIEDVKSTLEGYKNSMEDQVKKLISDGLGESDKAVEEVKEEITKINESMDSLSKQIKFIGVGVPGLKAALDHNETSFETSNVIKALFRMSNAAENGGGDPWRGCEQEKEIIDAWQKEVKTRATGNYATDGSDGAYMIPPEVTAPISLIARETSVFESMLPTTVLNGVVGNLIIPTIKTGTTAYMVGENEGPTASKLSFGSIEMNPRRAAGLTFVSKSLLYQAGAAMSGVINRDLGEALGTKKHQMLLTGIGNENQPSGLMASKWGISTSTFAGDTNGGRFNITDALMAKAELEENNEHKGNPANYAFLMRPIVKAGMATERITQYSGQAAKRGQPVLQNMGFLDDNTLAGIIGKFATSTYLPATETKGTDTTNTLSSLYYGDWSRFWIANWQGMTIRVSDQATVSNISAFSQNGMFVIVEEAFNCAVVRPLAFRRITGAQTVPSQWS